jgi:uncharacterized protein YqgC (DUF456 family)
MKLKSSQIVAMLVALSAAIMGTVGLIDQINPKLAIILTVLATFIAVFCKNVADVFRDEKPAVEHEDEP